MLSIFNTSKIFIQLPKILLNIVNVCYERKFPIWYDDDYEMIEKPNVPKYQHLFPLFSLVSSLSDAKVVEDEDYGDDANLSTIQLLSRSATAAKRCVSYVIVLYRISKVRRS